MLFFVIGFLIVACDVVTKILALNMLKPIDTLPLWEGVFHLTYVENRGAAFGIFQDGRWFFIILTVLALIGVFYLMRRYGGKSKIFDTAITFLVAGAVGNLADRIFRGFVVDFLDFRLIDFPVFNVADIFVCIGAGLLVLWIMVFDENNRSKKDCEEDEI